MKAIVAERGQVTLPKALRDQLGIRPGTVLDFTIQDNHLVAEKAIMEDPVTKVFGCLKQKLHTDDIIQEIRGKE